MHVLSQKKSDTIKVRVTTSRTGHIAHRSGNGVHQDKRLHRLNTRQARNAAAVREYD